MSYQISYNDQEDLRAEALRLLEQGNKQYKAFKFDIALQLYQQALDIFQELGEKTSVDRGNVWVALNNIGLVYSSQNHYEQALKFLQQALDISRENHDQVAQGTSLHNIAWVYENWGRTKDRFPGGDKPFYENQDLVNRALEFYHQALTIRKKVDDKAGVSDTLRNIGAIYENLEQFDRAREFYQQAIAIYKELGDRSSVATIICKSRVPNLLNSDDPFYPEQCTRDSGGDPSDPPTVKGPK